MIEYKGCKLSLTDGRVSVYAFNGKWLRIFPSIVIYSLADARLLIDHHKEKVDRFSKCASIQM